MAEPRLVPLAEAPLVNKPVTRRRGRPPKKQPSTRDQVAQTLVELRPACTSVAAGVVDMAASSSEATTAANGTGVPPPKSREEAKKQLYATVQDLVQGKSKEERLHLLGGLMDVAMRDAVEPLVHKLVRQDPRTAELIEVKKDLKEIEAKLEENKHFDQRVLEEGQKMKRHFDEALAELAPLKKRLSEATSPTATASPAPPPVPDPRVDKLEKQNAALMARMSAMEARLGAIEVEGK